MATANRVGSTVCLRGVESQRLQQFHVAHALRMQAQDIGCVMREAQLR